MRHRKSGQESIFSKREQIHLVEDINVGFGIHFDHSIGDDDGTPDNPFLQYKCGRGEQPGKQVMEVNKLSKAFERRCSTRRLGSSSIRLFVRFRAWFLQIPMMAESPALEATRRLRVSGYRLRQRQSVLNRKKVSLPCPHPQ